MQIIIEEKIFTAHIISESLILRITLLQINKNMKNNQTEKWAKGMNLHFTEDKT